jgi:hypothetical protein
MKMQPRQCWHGQTSMPRARRRQPTDDGTARRPRRMVAVAGQALARRNRGPRAKAAAPATSGRFQPRHHPSQSDRSERRKAAVCGRRRRGTPRAAMRPSANPCAACAVHRDQVAWYPRADSETPSASAKVRVTPRARNRSDVGKAADVVRAKQLDELIQRAC